MAFFLEMTKPRESEREDEGEQWGMELKDSWKWTTNEGAETVAIRERRVHIYCMCQTDTIPLLYLSKPCLAVSDVSPVFAGQAVRQFVLPDKRFALSAGAALQPSCPLGNDAPHRLGHAEVALKHRQTWSLLLAHSLHRRRFPDPLFITRALTFPTAYAIHSFWLSVAERLTSCKGLRKRCSFP